MSRTYNACQRRTKASERSHGCKKRMKPNPKNARHGISFHNSGSRGRSHDCIATDILEPIWDEGSLLVVDEAFTTTTISPSPLLLQSSIFHPSISTKIDIVVRVPKVQHFSSSSGYITIMTILYRQSRKSFKMACPVEIQCLGETAAKFNCLKMVILWIT